MIFNHVLLLIVYFVYRFYLKKEGDLLWFYHGLIWVALSFVRVVAFDGGGCLNMIFYRYCWLLG